MRKLTLSAGRYLPAADADRDRPVCVVGTKVAGELFPGRNPLGEMLRVGDERYRVIGVMGPRGMSMGMDMDEVVHVPVSRRPTPAGIIAARFAAAPRRTRPGAPR